jgi:hypothetical protein
MLAYGPGNDVPVRQRRLGQTDCCAQHTGRRRGPARSLSGQCRQTMRPGVGTGYGSSAVRHAPCDVGAGICRTAHTMDSRMDASFHRLTLTEPPGDREFSDDFVKV